MYLVGLCRVSSHALLAGTDDRQKRKRVARTVVLIIAICISASNNGRIMIGLGLCNYTLKKKVIKNVM